LREATGQLAPPQDVNAEETFFLVPFADGASVLLKGGIVGRGDGDRELGKGWPEAFGLDNLTIDLGGGELLLGWPRAAFAFALDASQSAGGRRPVYVHPMLTLALAAIARGIAITPFVAEEVGAKFLEFTPVFRRGQVGGRSCGHLLRRSRAELVCGPLYQTAAWRCGISSENRSGEWVQAQAGSRTILCEEGGCNGMR
jgi:hypothetical protein